jgi:hypothetical protein
VLTWSWRASDIATGATERLTAASALTRAQPSFTTLMIALFQYDFSIRITYYTRLLHATLTQLHTSQLAIRYSSPIVFSKYEPIPTGIVRPNLQSPIC